MRFTRICLARPPRPRPRGSIADLEPASEYKLSTALHKRASENTAGRIETGSVNIPNGRVNVVSPELCDDVLNLISPSLEKYQGCELFDINPGPGLWSTKLRERLKPSISHCIQPKAETEYYEPWTKKLLRQSSTTSHLYEQATSESNSERQASPFMRLVNQPEVDLLRSLWGKPQAETVVVSANYGEIKRLVSQDTNNRVHIPSRTIMRTLTEIVRKNSKAFHGKKIRFLLWTNEEDVPIFLPRSLYWWRLLPMELEYDYDITQLVTATQLNLPGDRPPWMTAQSAVWAAQRMLQSGRIHSPNRQDPLHKEIMKQLKLAESRDPKGLPSKPQIQQDVDDIIKTIQRVYRGEVSYRAPAAKGSATGKRTGVSPEWQRVVDNLNNLAELTSQGYPPIRESYDRIKDCNLFLELHLLEVAIEAAKSCNEDTYNLELKASRLIDIVKTKDMQVGHTRKSFWEGKHSRVDNHLATFRSDPLFAWDSRQFEPLQARVEEFWPRLPLTLLDFELKDHVLERPNPFLTSFIRAFFMNRQKTVAQTLDNLVLGAADNMLPNCPTILSPSHGGTFHPEYMNPMLLTHEMLAELQAAWDEYPFKLNERTLRAMDSSEVALAIQDDTPDEEEDPFEEFLKS